MRKLFGVVLISLLCFSLSDCGSKSAPSGGSSTSITVSGNLSANSLLNLRRFLRKNEKSSKGTSSLVTDSGLSGATMSCTTLTSTPVSATGTSDNSGNVSVTLASSVNQPFACFLSESGASTTIPMLFSNGSSSSTMAVASSDVSLGTIPVTTNLDGSVLASATLPTVGTLQTTTPPGVSCPAGLWNATTTQTCNGNATSYQLLFTANADGTYSSAFTEINGVTGTIHITGNLTQNSNCITSPSSTTDIAVGDTITDLSDWTTNPGGAAVVPTPGTTIVANTTCPSGTLQMSNSVSSSETGDSFMITKCGTTAHNTSNVTYSYDSSANTPVSVSLSYPAPCYDVAFEHLSGNGSTALAAGFTADLTSGSQCLSNYNFPASLAAGSQIEDADTSGAYIPNNKVVKVSASQECGAGSFEMIDNSGQKVLSAKTGIELIAVVNGTAASFYGSLTVNSECVSLALPPSSGSSTLTGYFAGDSAHAIASSTSSGVTLVPATGDCAASGMAPYMLSQAAGSNATTGETVVVIPALSSSACSMGICFDAHGNSYSGVATCPTGNAQLTAQTEVDTYPINSQCTEIWQSQSNVCPIAGPSDPSLNNACSGGVVTQNSLNTPSAATRALYAQKHNHCAACFPVSSGAPSTYPLDGCVGYGNANCTATGNGSDNSNIVLIKQ